MPDGGLRIRRLPAPATADAGARSVEAVLATDAPLLRRSGRPDGAPGAWLEVLLCRTGALDVNRAGVALLVDHDHTTDSIVGTVADIAAKGSEVMATLQFGTSERAERVWQRVLAGELSALSIGYAVRSWQRRPGEAATPAFEATSWEILEASFVAVPADAGARLRAFDGGHMDNTDTGVVADDTTNPDIALRAAETERQRLAEITKLARTARADAATVDELISAGASVEVARRRLWDDLVARSAPNERIRMRLGEDHSDPAHLQRRMTDALYARLTGTAPAEAAREFRALRLVDMLRSLAAARGERVHGLTDVEVLTRAYGQHTTSDLPNLLAAAGNRVLADGYEAAQSAFKQVSRQTFAPDFRPIATIRFGEAPMLLEVSEHGEIKHGSTDEAAEAYSLKTYARIFALSRKAMINDDLGAFADWARWIGRAAAEAEAAAFIALLAANGGAGPTMGDGTALFHADHGNTAAGGAIDVTTLAAARQAVRTQKGLDGTTPIGGTPRFLVTGPAKETEAEQVLSAIYPATAATSNPFSGRLELLVEPRLSGNQWFIFCDPAQLPVLQHSYLEGQTGPQVASAEDFDTLGLKFRCLLDFGVGVIDHRGAYRNPGN